jgi:hypothetical protein
MSGYSFEIGFGTHIQFSLETMLSPPKTDVSSLYLPKRLNWLIKCIASVEYLVFKDPMATAAAIDRLVHHGIILELNIPSYRMEQAQKDRNSTTDASETAR